LPCEQTVFDPVNKTMRVIPIGGLIQAHSPNIRRPLSGAFILPQGLRINLMRRSGDPEGEVPNTRANSMREHSR